MIPTCRKQKSRSGFPFYQSQFTEKESRSQGWPTIDSFRITALPYTFKATLQLGRIAMDEDARVSQCLEIRTTAGTFSEAESIAAALVENRLAACAQIIGPVKSVYRWEGKVESAEEYLLLVKTSSDRYGAVESEIRRLHSYQVPEILAVPVDLGFDAYLAWLRDQVSPVPLP